jgi:hypothetical protein
VVEQLSAYLQIAEAVVMAKAVELHVEQLIVGVVEALLKAA